MPIRDGRRIDVSGEELLPALKNEGLVQAYVEITGQGAYSARLRLYGWEAEGSGFRIKYADENLHQGMSRIGLEHHHREPFAQKLLEELCCHEGALLTNATINVTEPRTSEGGTVYKIGSGELYTIRGVGYSSLDDALAARGREQQPRNWLTGFR